MKFVRNVRHVQKIHDMMQAVKFSYDRESGPKHRLSYFCGKEVPGSSTLLLVLACITFGIFAPISPKVR